MTKMFIGGSRKLSSLNVNVKTKLDAIIQKKYTILIGDANGADKSVQKHLLNRHYSNVVVFCMSDGCRNNLGRWETRHIQICGNKKGFEYYSAKDMEMAKEADYGFMLWDAKSKGTLQNIINLLRSNKRTLVYISPEQDFLVLDALSDIKNLLAKCDAKYRDLFENKFKISHILQQESIQNELNLVA
jgi:hypothetical protein